MDTASPIKFKSYKQFSPRVILKAKEEVKSVKSSSKYSYSKLSECLSIAENKANEAHNFCAVIVDATYPHRA